MNYQSHISGDGFGRHQTDTAAPTVQTASILSGSDVFNRDGERLGSIKDVVLDLLNGKVCYAVLSFGGFLSMGEKLFAVPWGALSFDTKTRRFIFDVGPEHLKDAPGFKKDQWPDMADCSWADKIHSYYRGQAGAAKRNVQNSF